MKVIDITPFQKAKGYEDIAQAIRDALKTATMMDSDPTAKAHLAAMVLFDELLALGESTIDTVKRQEALRFMRMVHEIGESIAEGKLGGSK